MGTRPVTAVLTRAEKDKFNREALRFLFNPARRQQLGTQIPQAVDFDQFSVRWNEDVAVSEHHIRYGRLERDPDPENIINRKTPASLKSYWTDSRKRTNAKATMENVRDQLSDLWRSRTVAVTAQDAPPASASGESRGASGVMGNGLRASFPPLPTQDCPHPRPQPPQYFASCHGTLGARGGTSAIGDVAMASEAGCEGESAVDGGELFAGSSGSGFMSDARIILAVRVQVHRLRGGATRLPRHRFGEAGQIHLLVPRFQQLHRPMQRVPTPCAMVRLCRSRC